MSDMVERVARAMFPLVPNCRGRSFEDHPMRYNLMDKARAAIKAMRDPTDQMVRAARKDHEGEHFLPVSLWQSMVDAALKGEAE